MHARGRLAPGLAGARKPRFGPMAPTPRVGVSRALLRQMYGWTMSLAAGRHAPPRSPSSLFAESSFFPIPPDVLLVPMVLARRDGPGSMPRSARSPRFLGGILGYAIGVWLFASLGEWLIRMYGLADDMQTFQASYAEWGAAIILLKGLTPIPYKLVTIASGFAHYNFWLFVLLSAITRAHASSWRPGCSGSTASRSSVHRESPGVGHARLRRHPGDRLPAREADLRRSGSPPPFLLPLREKVAREGRMRGSLAGWCFSMSSRAGFAEREVPPHPPAKRAPSPARGEGSPALRPPRGQARRSIRATKNPSVPVVAGESLSAEPVCPAISIRV